MSARKTRVPPRLRERVARTAGYCCGYCRTPERIAGFRLSIKHIIPVAAGGATVEANLWLSCHACNEFKAARIRAHAEVERPLCDQCPCRTPWSWSIDLIS